ncbi:MAG: ribonuclease HII, partial [Chloroflexota bacterium]
AYGFERHKGYGTKAHQEALRSDGVIDGVHRRTYKPIAKLLASQV